MARVQVTRRVIINNRWEYIKEPETFRNYAEAVRHYNGEQAWFDKEWHRFVANGDLYYMEKVN